MATPIDPRSYGGATPTDPYSVAAAKRTGPIQPVARFVWDAFGKPVLRTAAAPVLGFGTEVKNSLGYEGDWTIPVPGTSTVLRPGISSDALKKATSKNAVTRQEGLDFMRRQSAEQLGDAATVGLTLIPGVGSATSKIGGTVANKIAAKGGGKVLQTLGKYGTQAAGDYAIGGVVGGAASVAEGEKDPAKILQRANATGMFSAALPLAFQGAAAAIPAARNTIFRAVTAPNKDYRSVSGVKNILLGNKKSAFGDVLEEAEKGWAAKRAAKEAADTLAERSMVKVPGPNGEVLEIQKRFAQGNLNAPNANRTLGTKLHDLADDIGKKVGSVADDISTKTVRGLRRFDTRFLNSEAPIEALATKFDDMDAESANKIRTAQSEFQARRDIAYGRALETNDDIINKQLKADPRLHSALDQMSDVRTKLETERLTATPEARAALQADLNKTLAQLSPNDRRLVEEAHKASIIANEANLDRMVEGGLLSAEKAKLLKEKHPNYSKLMVKEYVEGGSNSFGGQSSQRALKETGLKGRKAGAALDLDTLSATEANTLNHAMTEERVLTNARAQALVDADVKNGAGLFTKLEKEAPDAITVFRNGEKEFYKATDPRVAEYFQHQATELNKVPEWMNDMTQFTKKYATQVNPLFSAKNFIRDQQDRMANIGLDFSPTRLAHSTSEAWKHVNGKPTELTLRAAKLGGPLSSAGYDTAGGFRRLVDRGVKGGPAEQVKKLAETSELATRINILQEAERAGITDPVKLRELMRNGTLDFSIAGDWSREANKAIPFLTAGINGIRTQLKSLARDPGGYARRQQLLAIYPQILLDSHNSRYDSAANISQNEKNLNHIFVYGEGKDSEGKPFPKYFKIPKGQSTRLFANITQILTNDRLTNKEMAGAVANQFASMIPVVNSESSTPVPMPFGSIGQTLYGLQSNKDYMGREIVSKGNLDKNALAQSNKYTSQLAKDLTQALAGATGIEISPAKLEYGFRTVWSGTGSQITSAATMAYDVGKTGELSSAQDQSLGAAAATAPLLQGFFGTSNTGIPLDVRLKNQEVEEGTKRSSFYQDEQNKANLDRFKNAKTEEELDQVIADLSATGQLTKDFVDYAKSQAKKKVGTYGVDPTASSNMKAVQMTNYLDSLDSKEQYDAAIDEFASKNLLTQDVVDSITAYKAYRKLDGASEADRNQLIDQMAADGTLTEAVVKKMIEYKQTGSP